MKTLTFISSSLMQSLKSDACFSSWHQKILDELKLLFCCELLQHAGMSHCHGHSLPFESGQCEDGEFASNRHSGGEGNFEQSRSEGQEV